jgi:hypothetical protein
LSFPEIPDGTLRNRTNGWVNGNQAVAKTIYEGYEKGDIEVKIMKFSANVAPF